MQPPIRADLIANMTIGDLARLGSKTPAEIAAFALSGTSLTATTPRATPKPRPPKRSKASTPTAEGRGGFDAKILDAIKAAGEPVRSVDIEAKVGGTPEQRRAALHRLVAAKKIKRAGVARATTYEAR